MKTIKVFLVDDHQLVLEGLKTLLSDFEDIEITGLANSVSTAMNNKALNHSNILLLDDRLEGHSGIASTPEIKKKFPKLKIIILTSFMEADLVLKAVQAEVDGFLLKDLNTDSLYKNIRHVAKGGKAIPKDQSIKISDLFSNPIDKNQVPEWQLLTSQEKTISEMVSKGLINKEIADKTDLSEQTIKNYLTNIFTKLKINRRSQLAVLHEKSLNLKGREG